MNKSIINEICINNVILRKRVFSDEHGKLSDAAYKLYEKLNDILNDEQKKIFKEYVDTETAACSEADTAHFREGVKTGLLLAIECLT